MFICDSMFICDLCKEERESRLVIEFKIDELVTEMGMKKNHYIVCLKCWLKSMGVEE